MARRRGVLAASRGPASLAPVVPSPEIGPRHDTDAKPVGSIALASHPPLGGGPRRAADAAPRHPVHRRAAGRSRGGARNPHRKADGGADRRHRIAHPPQGPDHPSARDRGLAPAIRGERQDDHRRLPADPSRAGQRAQLPAQHRRHQLRRRRHHPHQPAQPRHPAHAGAHQRAARGAGRARRVVRGRPEHHPDRGGREDRSAQGWRLGRLRLRRHRRRGQHHHSPHLRRREPGGAVRSLPARRRADLRRPRHRRPH